MRRLSGVGFGRAPRPNAPRVALSAASPRSSFLLACGLSAAIAHANNDSIMKRLILWTILALLVVGLFIKNWSWPVSRDEMIGTYVNTSFSHVPCCAEAPHEPDTLRLLADGTMVSGFYGIGTWELEGHGNSVHWSYPCEYGTDWEHQHVKGMCGYSASIDNEIGQPIRLVLNWDWDHHYKKVE